MHRRSRAWMLTAAVWTACAAKEQPVTARDGAQPPPAISTEPQAGQPSTRPSPPSTAAEPRATAVEPSVSGVRAPPENDAPPRPVGPARPLQPPPKLDGKRTAPVPPLDRTKPPVAVPPRGPVNEAPPSTDR